MEFFVFPVTSIIELYWILVMTAVGCLGFSVLTALEWRMARNKYWSAAGKPEYVRRGFSYYLMWITGPLLICAAMLGVFNLALFILTLI